MVVINVVIQKNKALDVEFNVLIREDATESEMQMAKLIKSGLFIYFKQLEIDTMINLSDYNGLRET
jgi:hypothetical protein